LPDLNNDNFVNLRDLVIFVFHWLDAGCISPDFCEANDFDKSGIVNIADFSEFSDHWLEDN
jgi:hypothetical protein